MFLLFLDNYFYLLFFTFILGSFKIMKAAASYGKNTAKGKKEKLIAKDNHLFVSTITKYTPWAFTALTAWIEIVKLGVNSH